jgi:hypothetical protein
VEREIKQPLGQQKIKKKSMHIRCNKTMNWQKEIIFENNNI